MLKYTLKRIFYMMLTLLAVSVVAFFIIQLPPGDYLDNMIAEKEAQGQKVHKDEVAALRKLYGLDDALIVQYCKWTGFSWVGKAAINTVTGNLAWFTENEKGERGILQGYLGRSFEHQRPVTELLAERLPLSLLLSISATILVYIIALPVGIYSATHKYTIADYAGMFVSFAGMSVPPFFLALVVMFVLFKYFGFTPGGIFSPEFVDVNWSIARVKDVIQHMLVPLLVIGIGGTSGLIRVMRANLLDELKQLYVTTARAKGVAEWKLLIKYPVRVAITPVVSSLGFILPTLISGQAIISIVLGLPTLGPLLLSAVMSEDMFLASSVIMIQTALVVVGVFLSDILLMVVDPRIRLTGGTK